MLASPLTWAFLCGVLPLAAAHAAVTNAGATPINPADYDFASRPSLRTLYVAQDKCGTSQNQPCSDSNNGLSRQFAKRTIAHAATVMQPGDLLLVEAGPNPYVERVFLEPQHSGTSTLPKRIAGTNGTPRILPAWSSSKNKYQNPITLTSHYWVLDNLEIDCRDPQGTPQDVIGVHPLGAHHVALRRLTIHDCMEDAILVRGSEHVLIEGSTFYNNIGRTAAGVRTDSNGVDIEPGVLSNGQPVPSRHIVIRGNVAWGNSGDGVQCQGGEQINWAVYDPAWSSTDITISNNHFYNNGENAVDIKSCEGVSIIGENHFADYDGEGDNDESNGGCSGAAVVLHYSAKRVLIEGARIHDSGVGIEIGNEWQGPVSDVLIRRNLVFDLDQETYNVPRVPPGTGTLLRANCGDGITVHRAERVDIVHNTIDAAKHSGISIGVNTYYALPNPHHSNATIGPAATVRVWNNIITNVEGIPYVGSTKTGGTLDINTTNAPGLESHNNLFQSLNTSIPVRFRRCTGLNPTQCDDTLSLAGWQAAGLDTSSTEAAASTALFSTRLSETGYWTPLGSPARNTAVLDATHNARPTERCAGNPDRGARESDCWTSLASDLSALPTDYTGVNSFSLQMDGQGHPVMAWTESADPFDPENPDSPAHVYVQRWNGSAWTQLGGALGNPTVGVSGELFLRLDGNGAPVVAWQEWESTFTRTFIKVAQWSGTAWVELGAAVDASSSSGALYSLELDSTGQPVVLWKRTTQESPGPKYELQVSRWTGTAWSTLPSPLRAHPGYSSVHVGSMTLDSSNHPVLAWTEYDWSTQKYTAYAQRWTGSTWTLVGGALGEHSSQVLLDGSQVPIVLVRQDGAYRVKRWNGSAWQDVGGSLMPSVWSGQTVALDSPYKLRLDGAGNLLLMTSEANRPVSTTHRLSVRRWSGTQWDLLAFVDTGSYVYYWPEFALDSSGRIYLAWLALSSTSSTTGINLMRTQP